jgi:hypothetical protein
VKSVDEEIKSFRKIMHESMLSDPRRACVRNYGDPRCACVCMTSLGVTCVGGSLDVMGWPAL